VVFLHLAWHEALFLPIVVLAILLLSIAGEGYRIWVQRSQIADLTSDIGGLNQEISSLKRKLRDLDSIIKADDSQRAELSREAARLEKLLHGRERFDEYTSAADKAWEKLVSNNKFMLASPQPMNSPQPGRWYELIGNWQRGHLARIDMLAKSLFGSDYMSGWGHTSHYDPAVKVQGEENITNEENLKIWRNTLDVHQHFEDYVTATRQKINSEIDQLLKKLAAQ
jgi:hypothetical protein